ncbi:MAG TPA: hypothetical protein VMU09_07680, partial [Acidimicrobiales bacterium]|nr:hypothetical protein [Acidimicrobiales bacterium]
MCQRTPPYTWNTSIRWVLKLTTWDIGIVSPCPGGGEGGFEVQHGALWVAVPSSTATTVVHVGSTSHGGTQAATRQTMRPM